MRRSELLDIADGFAIDEAWEAALELIEGFFVGKGQMSPDLDRQKLHEHIAPEDIGTIGFGFSPFEHDLWTVDDFLDGDGALVEAARSLRLYACLISRYVNVFFDVGCSKPCNI